MRHTRDLIFYFLSRSVETRLVLRCRDAYFWGAQGNMWQSACFEDHWTIGRKTILVHIIRNLILAVFRKISRHRRVICKVPPISVARISSWGILCRNLCCHRPESVIAAFICHAIIYSLSLVCPIYLIPKLSEDMVTKDGAVVKLIRCNVLFLWV